MTEPILTRSAPVDTIETRTMAIAGVDIETRTISGIAVPFGEIANVGYQEEFRRGAIADGSEVPVHVNHGGLARGELPIGRTLNGRNSDAAYHLEARIAETNRGDEVLELARAGVLKYFSIAFAPIEHEMRGDVVVRTKVDLREVSIVERPAYKGAVIESVRSAATETDTDMTPEEIAELVAKHPTFTELRTANDTLTRRLGVLEDGPARGGRSEFKTRSAGDVLKGLLTRDTEIIEEFRRATESVERDRISNRSVETRAYTGQTLAVEGLDRPVWLEKLLHLTNLARPLSTLFSREPLPATGTTFEYPFVKTETGTVGKQVAEGDDLGFMKLVIDTKGGSVQTVGGYTSLSRQAIERNTVPLLDASLRYMAIQYAEDFERVVQAWLQSIPTTAGDASLRANLIALGAAGKPDTAAEWISVVIDARAMINDNAKGGKTADFIVASRDVSKGIALITDTTGRPIFNVKGDGQNSFGTMNFDSVEVSGEIANVPLVTIPRLPANTFKVCSRDAVTSMESSGAPFRLQDENIINLTQDFSMYGYEGVYTEQSKAMTAVTWNV